MITLSIYGPLMYQIIKYHNRSSKVKLTSSSVSSPARLFMSTSAFLHTRLAYLRPTPCYIQKLFVSNLIIHSKSFTLIDVNPYIIFCLPSMFVLSTRRMCWKPSGKTSDCKQIAIEKCSYVLNHPGRII